MTRGGINLHEMWLQQQVGTQAITLLLELWNVCPRHDILLQLV
jgi:hypothetical protein